MSELASTQIWIALGKKVIRPRTLRTGFSGVAGSRPAHASAALLADVMPRSASPDETRSRLGPEPPGCTPTTLSGNAPRIRSPRPVATTLNVPPLGPPPIFRKSGSCACDAVVNENVAAAAAPAAASTKRGCKVFVIWNLPLCAGTVGGAISPGQGRTFQIMIKNRHL